MKPRWRGERFVTARINGRGGGGGGGGGGVGFFPHPTQHGGGVFFLFVFVGWGEPKSWDSGRTATVNLGT